MKKWFLFLTLFFSAASFISCSDDGDDKKIVSDKIIGNWQYEHLFLNGEEIPLTTCEQKDVLHIFQNGTFTENDFEEGENEECVALDPFNGTWKYLGNSIYEFGDLEIFPGKKMDVNVEVSFSGNNMTLKYAGPDGNGDMQELEVVYIRI